MRSLTADQWHRRIGDDSIELFSPTLRRSVFITPAEADLLTLPVLQVGWRVTLRRLLPLTQYRSVSGLWRAIRTLDALGLLQRSIRQGRHALRVRTLVRGDKSPVQTIDLRGTSMVRTASTSSVGDVLERLVPTLRVALLSQRASGAILIEP